MYEEHCLEVLDSENLCNEEPKIQKNLTKFLSDEKQLVVERETYDYFGSTKGNSGSFIVEDEVKNFDDIEDVNYLQNLNLHNYYFDINMNDDRELVELVDLEIEKNFVELPVQDEEDIVEDSSVNIETEFSKEENVDDIMRYLNKKHVRNCFANDDITIKLKKYTNLKTETLISNIFNVNLKIFDEDDENTEKTKINEKDYAMKPFESQIPPMKPDLPKKTIKNKKKNEGVRKTIKVDAHRSIEEQINQQLIEAGSLLTFDKLPQNFLSSVTVELNKVTLNLTMGELYQKDFGYEANSKLVHNKKVMEYLKTKPMIRKKSKFAIFEHLKYEEVLNIYFQPDNYHFLKSVERLRSKGKSEDYIKEYKVFAFDYVNYIKNEPIRHQNKLNNER